MLFPQRNAIGPKERAAILECIGYYRQSGEDLPYGGHFYKRYAKALTDYFGTKYALPVSSGTTALYAAVKALRLPAGSTVICSPITDPGCISAITMNDLVLKVADCTQDSFSMDPEQLQSVLTDSVSAVMYVHAAGHASDLSALRTYLDGRGIFLIEDVSQAHGAGVDGKKAGQFGHIAALSTMYRKAHITGSNGGVVLTDSNEFYRHAIKHSDRGKDKLSPDFDDRNPYAYDLPALNFNLDEIACAIGCASLSRLDETRQKRLSFTSHLREMLATDQSAIVPFAFRSTDSPFVILMKCPSEWAQDQKIDFATTLRDKGVPLNPHYRYLVPEWTYGLKCGLSIKDVPRAKQAIDSHFCLYVNENYGEQEAAFVAKTIRSLL